MSQSTCVRLRQEWTVRLLIPQGIDICSRPIVVVEDRVPAGQTKLLGDDLQPVSLGGGTVINDGAAGTRLHKDSPPRNNEVFLRA